MTGDGDIKAGDVVMCICRDNLTNVLTLGRAYQIMEVNEKGFLIHDDTLYLRTVPASYFVPLEAPLLTRTTGAGTKFDQDKPRMELLSSVAIAEIAKVQTFGARKYADHNWRKGMAWGRLLGAALRHLFAWLAGEDKDPESGLSHLAHAATDIMFLLEYELKGLGTDDRHRG